MCSLSYTQLQLRYLLCPHPFSSTSIPPIFQIQVTVIRLNFFELGYIQTWPHQLPSTTSKELTRCTGKVDMPKLWVFIPMLFLWLKQTPKRSLFTVIVLLVSSNFTISKRLHLYLLNYIKHLFNSTSQTLNLMLWPFWFRMASWYIVLWHHHSGNKWLLFWKFNLLLNSAWVIKFSLFSNNMVQMKQKGLSFFLFKLNVYPTCLDFKFQINKSTFFFLDWIPP